MPEILIRAIAFIPVQFQTGYNVNIRGKNLYWWYFDIFSSKTGFVPFASKMIDEETGRDRVLLSYVFSYQQYGVIELPNNMCNLHIFSQSRYLKLNLQPSE